ncbi:Putative fatty acyl-CoA reductase CG5065 [Eumeta japonica]|uniref:Fatty acyl-CoA reductase CG5065 n=1 Tax=Eumeta variegata TaxID=151549 RepID=A0A4C1Z6K8_EUMVA|nr:Putative fatty acyl-CoA reductase CG5065 [Eumeta japonica]
MAIDMSTEKEGGDITFEHMVDETEQLGESEIQKFFAGATALVTGGTGFLGKLLIEKLLRPVRKLQAGEVVLMAVAIALSFCVF